MYVSNCYLKSLTGVQSSGALSAQHLVLMYGLRFQNLLLSTILVELDVGCNLRSYLLHLICISCQHLRSSILK